MVLKRIVILTKSKKLEHFCVAGIEVNSGEWIRIVTNDNKSNYAVTQAAMMLSNGGEADILDVVDIDFLRHKPLYYQPENWLMNPAARWRKIGTKDFHEVFNIHPVEERDFIFYDSENFVARQTVENKAESNRYSLTLIRPDTLEISVKKFERTKVSAHFNYSGSQYSYLQITDPDIIKRYSKLNEGWHKIGNCYLVISLAAFYTPSVATKAGHYKVIAKIFNF